MSVSGRVVVVGAGIVGAATAYALTRRGRPPVIVERARPGAAATGRAGGFLALDWNDSTPAEDLARRSFALHRELAGVLGTDTGYRPVETLLVAGVDGGRIDLPGETPRPPWLDPAISVHSVIGTPETTAQVNPAVLTAALVDAAVAGGATLRVGTVRGLDLSGPGGAVRAVTVGPDSVPADHVVLAMGPWTRDAARWVALPRIHALRGASITLAADLPAQAVFSDFITRDGRRLSPEIYPRPDGEVYVNGVPEDDPLPDEPDDITPSTAACDELHRLAGLHSPVLAGAAVTARRACYRPVAVDGVPVIGPVPGAPGVFVATGHGAWGILNAPATGEMLAEMILDGRAHSLDPRPFDPARLPAEA